MPNDALNYSFIASELNNCLAGSRIEKIYMPTAGEIILKCHSGKNTYFLLASAVASAPRIHLTRALKENPITAPSFLMHLRKHIGNGIILGVTAQPYERVVMIDILCKSEFVEAKRRIIVEITGTYSNIILVDENNIISEAVKHITPDISPKRLVLPGLAYTTIPPQDKLLPNDKKIVELLAAFDGDSPDKYILSIMSGMAPATISECVVRAIGSIRRLNGAHEAEAIFNELNKIYTINKPCLIKHNGKYTDFYTSPFLSVIGDVESHTLLSECMDIYYANKNDYGELGAQIKRLLTILKNAEKRTRKKLEEFAIKKTECMDCESDRIKGELITANIYRIKKGEAATCVYNYYTDENVQIMLDINKTPAENAQAYYKKYTKKKNTLAALDKQIEDAKKLLLRYENALNSFELCSTRADLEDIEVELFQLKLLQNNEIKNRKKATSTYLSVTVDGYKIDIGKNNVQNERLYKSAGDKDIWLHVLGAHGSHVIIHCSDKEATDEVITSAAQLAAYYSKSKMADKVAVDYTYAKNVKPISGGGPGRVNYTNQKTLYVSPKSVIDFK
ncbi:MAG: NFACT family protein [Clostridiales bacterium]|nr:NFACT family protein [Clostridiales bacterium]